MTKTTLALVVGLTLPIAVQASVVYTGSNSFGSTSVDLSITTDGTIGVLARSNVLDWSFTLSNDGLTETHTAPAGGGDFDFTYLSGNAFKASATELFFDYTAIGHLQWDNFAHVGGASGICFSTLDAELSCSGNMPTEAVLISGTYSQTSRQGVLLLGTANNVPEPLSLALVSLGLFGVATTRNSRLRNH